ncbi:MAG: sulfite oxidase [Chloroflexota bacterium]|nr:sulfite oxidase [Chloroflexota bacterium]MDE2941318.1 sulfite oxidase [Chloroflexota bacterium]MDE3268582.1 sulfite oxidase [Chloroflexota bacterium]
MTDGSGLPPTRLDSAADSLWRFASVRGMDRRRFLLLMMAGGSAAVLAACLGTESPTATPPHTATPTTPAEGAAGPYFKDTAPFIERDGKGLETRLENLQGLITPNRYFFVRNNSTSIGLEAEDWRLSVEGDAVSEPLELTYDDVRSLPSRTLISYLECAGNHRAMFNLLNGRETSGTQWTRGAISNGEWLGVTLRDVLTLAGIGDDAKSVLLVGLDTESPEEGFRYVLPAEKALHSDTLLAYALNGETLPKDHGFPLRAVVPGWVGSSHIKWLGRIVVSSEQLWTRNNTTSYTLIGDAYAPEGESMGKPVTEQVIKSALALPWPAELAAGPRRIHGYAHSPAGPISRVEWSADSGLTWSAAELSGGQPDYSWARFEFEWDAAPGEFTITTRATDSAGNSQPDHVPFNEKGYLFNQPLPHPVRVV